MNWFNIFYWITRADSVKNFFDASSDIFTVFAVLSFIVYVFISAHAKTNADAKDAAVRKNEGLPAGNVGYNLLRKYFGWMFYSFLFLCLTTELGYVFTPTKKEMLLIVAAGGTMQYLTTDSVARQIPSEMSNFVVTELKSMAKEAQVDLGIASQKDKVLEEAKKMTSEQILEKIRIDSNFANIILNK